MKPVNIPTLYPVQVKLHFMSAASNMGFKSPFSTKISGGSRRISCKKKYQVYLQT